MKKEEIAELMRLRGWNRTDLAASMSLTENTIHKWFMRGGAPEGPASILMRLWLDEARASAQAADRAEAPAPNAVAREPVPA